MFSTEWKPRENGRNPHEDSTIPNPNAQDNNQKTTRYRIHGINISVASSFSIVVNMGNDGKQASYPHAHGYGASTFISCLIILSYIVHKVLSLSQACLQCNNASDSRINI